MNTILFLILAVAALGSFALLAVHLVKPHLTRATPTTRHPVSLTRQKGMKRTWRRRELPAEPAPSLARVLSFVTRHPRRGEVQFANIAEGIHANGRLSMRTDAAHSARFLLCKKGTDDAHIAIAGASDTPMYVCMDEAAAAEELVAVQAIACCKDTIRLVTNGAGALAAGDLVVAAASGKTAKCSASAGNYYVVGRVIRAVAATDGDIYEAVPLGCYITQ